MIMEGENRIGSAQEEMEILKKRIAELEASSQNKEKSEIIKEAIQEHVGKSPEEFLANEHKFTPQEIQDQAQRISNLPVEKQHQEQILELMQIVQAKGLLNALSIVDHIQDPHLEDEFHDVLVKYFQSTH